MFSGLNLWILFDGSLFTHGINQNQFTLILMHVIIILFIEYKFSKQENCITELTKLHIVIRWIIYILLIFDVILFGVYGTGYTLNSFMYGGF